MCLCAYTFMYSIMWSMLTANQYRQGNTTPKILPNNTVSAENYLVLAIVPPSCDIINQCGKWHLHFLDQKVMNSVKILFPWTRVHSTSSTASLKMCHICRVSADQQVVVPSRASFSLYVEVFSAKTLNPELPPRNLLECLCIFKKGTCSK